MSLTLFYHPLASYCHKVLIALYEHGVHFEKRVINLGDPADRAELQALWPPVKFPVLRDGGRALGESSIIIEYLEHIAPQRRLIADDWRDALDVRLWDRVFDNHVQTPMQEIVADRLFGREGDLTQQQGALDVAYAMIEARMAGREWVAGEAFSMADCAAAPALFYAQTVRPFPQECGHLRAYYERLMARPSVAQVMEEAKPFFGMYPFAENIPARFR
jgi:glutathione S-transferase